MESVFFCFLRGNGINSLAMGNKNAAIRKDAKQEEISRCDITMPMMQKTTLGIFPC